LLRNILRDVAHPCGAAFSWPNGSAAVCRTGGFSSKPAYQSKTKTPALVEQGFFVFGGEAGIRTLGRLPFNGFQVRDRGFFWSLPVTDYIKYQ